MLASQIKTEILKLEGPIVVFGAGGFIGSNLFRQILEYRDDVFAVTSKEPFVPWRIDDLRVDRVIHADITEMNDVKKLFNQHSFKTIFHLAAYGAYSKQADVKLIYRTNIFGLLNLLQVCSNYNIRAFVHAGSSSEYGINSKEPLESAELHPNSHYAVTKASAAQMIKYYGTILQFPIVNLRYYSIYGQYEEPDRLIPQLLEKGMQQAYPPLVQPDISRDFALDGVITLVDAVNGLSTLDHHQEARRQVAMADRLVLTKKTLADPSTIPELEARLTSLNPIASVVDGDTPDAARFAMLACGLYDPTTKIADVSRWLHDEAYHHHDHDHHHDGHDHHHHHHHHHDDAIRSFSIIHDRPIDPAAIGMFVDLLRSAHAEKLLRMKAVVQLADDPDRPLVLHGVQAVFHQPELLPRWPDPSDRRTRMVLITRDLPADFVQSLFDAFTGTPRIDQADRQALEDNPLAIPGMRI
ncbi:MAG: NAD-dependent epimerase/dehydratase family protein [Sphingobacteriales bacterium]|nr:MAG: NAD-dependent epimerase/dehydratase family protein [Sphingobacteriales bacterium]